MESFTDYCEAFDFRFKSFKNYKVTIHKGSSYGHGYMRTHIEIVDDQNKEIYKQNVVGSLYVEPSNVVNRETNRFRFRFLSMMSQMIILVTQGKVSDAEQIHQEIVTRFS